jgi:hypothetical protein
MRDHQDNPGTQKRKLMATIHETTASGGLALRDSAKVQIEKTLAMTPEADDFLVDLARRTRLKEGDVIRLALGMFKVALDAKDQGKHVGVADNSDALEIELVGF